MSLSIVSANILSPHTDRLRAQTPPQHERIPQIAGDFQTLDPDVLIVCEIQQSSADDCLAKLASETGMDVRVRADQKDADEGIAILTKPDIPILDEAIFEILPGERRFGIAAQIGDILVMGVHYPWQISHFRERTRITRHLVQRVQGHQQAIIAGDFNSLPLQRARHLFTQAGFLAATQALDRRTSGFPANYRHAQLPLGLGRLIPPIQVDDIYSRGFTHRTIGAVVTASDHPIIWAELVE
jgi:exonuclease III